MKSLKELVMEAVTGNTVIEEAGKVDYYVGEIQHAIDAAKKDDKDYVQCKFGTSKFINVNIANLEGLQNLIKKSMK